MKIDRTKPNYSMFLPDNVKAKIEKIRKETGISTKAGAIIHAIMNYKS